jgi:hypothetical protein
VNIPTASQGCGRQALDRSSTALRRRLPVNYVCLGDAGQLTHVKAKPDSYQELARIEAIGGKCWSAPVLSDGKIYVRSTTEAACFDVR